MATQNNFKAFYTVQKMKFSIKDFFSKSEHVTKSAGNCGIWSRLLKKSLMENFIFCEVLSWLHRGIFRILSNIYYRAYLRK